MTDRIGVLGTGLLRDAIADALGERATAPGPDAGVAMLVVASDAWDTSAHSVVRQRAATAGVPWLAVWTELGCAVIGPLEVPGKAGCLGCALVRRHRLRPDRAARAALRRRHREELRQRASSWLTGLAADLVGAVVTEDAGRVTSAASGRSGAEPAVKRPESGVTAGEPPRSWRALHRLDLARLDLIRHPFLPDPTCRVCGELPDDSAQAARLVLAPEPAFAPGSYRTRSRRADLPALIETYVDPEVGLIRSLDGWTAGGLVSTAAPLGWRNTGSTAGGFGAAGTFEESRLTAVLEALERYGSAPGGRRTVVEASYQDLSSEALDPRTLGLYPPQRYAQPGFPFAPFLPEETYRWVWGWSFARSAPILVPEQVAYYGVPHRHGRAPGFVQEVSNGCALGSGLAEAILYGVLEVAERDAFLLTWYARLPAPRIDLSTARDRTVPLLAAAIEAETGHQVLAFDISTEQRIPCVWAMAWSPSQAPAVACAAGAHPVPEVAVRRALRELGPSLTGLIRRCQDPEAMRRAGAMAADPTLVREMDDHALRYADPGAARRLEFLTGSQEARPIGEVEPGGFASQDLRANALEAVARYTSHGLDVIVVDQTAAEHRAGGFTCVKVLIPGTLPMTFGHRYRRVDGLPRLYEVPARLGYADRPLRRDEVDPSPHPFP